MNKLKRLWINIEKRVARWFPGFKTYIINALALIGTVAAALLAYVESVPFDRIVDAKVLGIVIVVLATLTFWLKGIGDRVDRIEKKQAEKKINETKCT